MHDPNTSCIPLDGGPCDPLPPWFSRLRYFFGKRLGVADFVDEQRYHAGKMRFHSRHLHGAGVVCGLAIGPFPDPTSGAPSKTVVRVGRGAALDHCGREIIVGFDQCIDVAAWYKRAYEERHVEAKTDWPLSEADLDADGKLGLCVVLRYAECSTDPEPAPRDPCSCDNGGCDFGRVREGFELALVTESEARPLAKRFAAAAFPAPEDLAKAWAQNAGTGDKLAAFLDKLVRASCPPPLADADADWLVLGCLRVTLDGARENAVEVAILPAPTPPVLWSTALLEELVVRGLGATLEAGALVDEAPTVTALRLTDTGGFKIDVAVELSAPVAAPSITAGVEGAITLRRWDTAAGWQKPDTGKLTAVTLRAAAGGKPAALVFTVDNSDAFLAADRFYRLAFVPHPEAPMVDDKLRPLRPLRWSAMFAIKAMATTPPEDLKLGPAPFAAP